jgi:hypothetical protein
MTSHFRIVVLINKFIHLICEVMLVNYKESPIRKFFRKKGHPENLKSIV